MKKTKENGITLVSLVVTIIILIILAGVSLNLTIGENGLFTTAKRARENIELAQIEEQTRMNELYDEMEQGGYYENPVVGELEGTIEELNKTIENLNAQLDDEKQQRGLLEGQVEGLKTELADEKTEKENLQTQLETTQSEKSNLQKELENTEAEKENLQSQLESKNSEIENLEGQITQKDTKIESLQTQLASKETELANKNKTISELEESKAQLETQVASLTTQVSDLQTQYNNMSKRLDTLESNITALQNSVNANNTSIANINKNLPKFNKVHVSVFINTSTTFSYTGKSYKIPANSYYSLTFAEYQNHSLPLTIGISTKENEFDGAVEGSIGEFSAFCNLNGYTEQERTLYIWSKCSSNGAENGVSIDGYYVTFPK